MTVSTTSAGVGIGAFTSGEMVATVGIVIGVLTALVNFVFWAYTQWGRVERESFAAWRDAKAAELVAEALAAAKAKLLVDEAAAAELVAVALATAKGRLLIVEASEDAIDRAAARAVQRALATGSKS